MPQATPQGWAPAPDAAPVGWAAAPEPPLASHAPQALQPPPGQFLGASTKPASLKAPTWRDRLNDVVSPESQRMIGGALGAAATTALMPEVGVPSLLVRAAAHLAPVVGAALGGATTAVAQGAPAKDIIPAGIAQGTVEAGGQLTAWPLNAVMRRLFAHPVATRAATTLEAGRTEVNRGLDEVLSQAEGAVRGTREGTARAVQQARGVARGAQAEVGMAEQAVEHATGRAKAQWPAAGGPPMAVSHSGPEAYAQTGQRTAGVIQGPAKHSLDRLGQNVERSAQSGPEIDFAPIKDRLEAMAEKARPSTMAGQAPPALLAFGGGSTKGEQSAFLEKLKASGVMGLDESHPLPGVLKAIQDAPDTLTFADAHKYKRMLDDAVNWDSPAKKQLQGMTKGIRNSLRETMGVHAPYNEATGAYKAAAPLFSKGYAKQVVRSAVDNPEAIAKLIKPDEPTKLQMLYDVLHTHAAEGGGAAEGKEAWNGVRSALTWKRLIQPGIEKFDQSLAKFHPDSLQLAYGDAEGKQVLDNLKQISEAFKSTQASGEAAVEGAQGVAQATKATANRTAEAGRTAVAARRTAQGQVQSQVRDLRRPTATESAFQSSSLANTAPPGQVVGEVLHAGALHGANVFRTRSIARLLFSGPKINDLVQWAAYSGKGTQLLVRAITGPEPGMALASVYRTAGIHDAQHDLAVSHQRGAPPR